VVSLVTTAEPPVRPVIAKPTGSLPCDRMENRIFEFLTQHVQTIEDPEDPAKQQDLRYMLMAYGVAVARHIFVIYSDAENDSQKALFDQIAHMTPSNYVRDVTTAIQLLSRRMRGKLLIHSNGTPEGRLAQQVILEGGNP
jgi:hypothetical protein